MKKNKAVRFYESTKFDGQLSILCNAREEIGNNKNFGYNWHRINYDKLFRNKDCIYCVENASGKTIEVEDIEDLNKNFNCEDAIFINNMFRKAIKENDKKELKYLTHAYGEDYLEAYEAEGEDHYSGLGEALL